MGRTLVTEQQGVNATSMSQKFGQQVEITERKGSTQCCGKSTYGHPTAIADHKAGTLRGSRRI
jgi:hypothetical protein